MSENENDKTHVNPSETKPDEKKETLAEYAARKLGWKIGKLPKGWCRVYFKR